VTGERTNVFLMGEPHQLFSIRSSYYTRAVDSELGN